jgi:hypothetical protein
MKKIISSTSTKIKPKNKEKKLEKVRGKQFNQEILNKQKSRILKRDAMQVKINRRLQELASKLEKEKIIEEKKQMKEFNSHLTREKKAMLEAFTKFWDDQIKMTKDRIEEEKMARKLIELTENKALSEWKKELNSKQKQKLEKYLNVLHQQDERYEVENLNLEKMEEQLIMMYKRI